MFTAKEAIDGARVLDPSLDENRHPDSVCFPFLTWWWRRMTGKIIRIDRDAISDEITIALPLADYDAGVALGTELLHQRGAEGVYASGERTNVRLVSFGNRFQPGYWPSAYIRGERLFLLGRENDWSSLTSIVVHGTAVPGTIDGPNDQLQLPALALEAASKALGAHLGGREPDALSTSLAVLEGRAQAAEEELLDTLQEADGATVSTIREVF